MQFLLLLLLKLVYAYPAGNSLLRAPNNRAPKLSVYRQGTGRHLSQISGFMSPSSSRPPPPFLSKSMNAQQAEVPSIKSTSLSSQTVFESGGGDSGRNGGRNSKETFETEYNIDDGSFNTGLLNCSINDYTEQSETKIWFRCFLEGDDYPELCVQATFNSITKVGYLSHVNGIGSMSTCPSAKESLKIMEAKLKSLGANQIEAYDGSNFLLFRSLPHDARANPTIRTLLWFSLFSDSPNPTSYYSLLGYHITGENGYKIHDPAWIQKLKDTHEYVRRIRVEQLIIYLRRQYRRKGALGTSDKKLIECLESLNPQLVLHEYFKREHQRLTRKPDLASQTALVELVGLIAGLPRFQVLSENCFMIKDI